MKLTKHLILSKLSGIFNSIGAGTAVLIKAKIAMKELWQHGLRWDEDVPPEIKRKWMKIFDEMIALTMSDSIDVSHLPVQHGIRIYLYFVMPPD